MNGAARIRMHQSEPIIVIKIGPRLEKKTNKWELSNFSTSTLVALSFSSMTCLSIVRADLQASFRVID